MHGASAFSLRSLSKRRVKAERSQILSLLQSLKRGSFLLELGKAGVFAPVLHSAFYSGMHLIGHREKPLSTRRRNGRAVRQACGFARSQGIGLSWPALDLATARGL
jgi:hypothetical protein